MQIFIRLVRRRKKSWWWSDKRLSCVSSNLSIWILKRLILGFHCINFSLHKFILMTWVVFLSSSTYLTQLIEPGIFAVCRYSFFCKKLTLPILNRCPQRRRSLRTRVWWWIDKRDLYLTCTCWSKTFLLVSEFRSYLGILWTLTIDNSWQIWLIHTGSRHIDLLIQHL